MSKKSRTFAAEFVKRVYMKQLFTVLMILWAAGMQAQVTILPPAETVSGTSYSFEQDGITVSCTKGAIYPATAEWNTSKVDYFGCHANETITFTAESPIKGLVINGFVKKFFSASTNNGTISYLSPEEDDQAADPVIVITDIDANSVSITCAKQLRCFNAVVYFDENPTDTIGGMTPPAEGEVFFFTYNTSNVAYDSTYHIASRPYNYYLYLWDSAQEELYVGLDIYTAEKDRFEGLYSTDDGTMTEYSFYQFGENFEDYTSAVEGMMVINPVEGKEGDYSISGYITCDNGNTYNFSFEGHVYLEDEEMEQGVERVEESKNNEASHKILRNGVVLIEKNGKHFTLTGEKL